MELILTHAEVERIVLNHVNTTYGLPVLVHHVQVVREAFAPDAFRVTPDAALDPKPVEPLTARDWLTALPLILITFGYWKPTPTGAKQ